MGTTQYIPQGEGGDPLMPMLYALGQHGSLVATPRADDWQRESVHLPG